MRCVVLFILMLLILILVGCSGNPFPDDRAEYAISFVIDRSSSYDDYLATSAFNHFASVKGILFQDVMGRESTIIVSQINGGQSDAILFEGSPRAFEQRFPNKDSFLKFIKQAPAGSSPVYRACAETFERLCRRHEENPAMHSIVLIYSDMGDNHGEKDRFDTALRRLSKFPTAVGVYGASEGWKSYLQQCGIRHAVAYDSVRVDPPLPQIP